MIDPFDAVLNAPKMARVVTHVVTLTFSHDTYVMPVLVTRSQHQAYKSGKPQPGTMGGSQPI